MESKELRIGNFYNQFGYVHIATGSTIKELENAPEQQLWCKPIPLTEEWLFNFNWNGYNPLHFNSNFEIDKQGRLYCNSDYKGVNVSYVHELQNLYFCLTGKELTLK